MVRFEGDQGEPLENGSVIGEDQDGGIWSESGQHQLCFILFVHVHRQQWQSEEHALQQQLFILNGRYHEHREGPGRTRDTRSQSCVRQVSGWVLSEMLLQEMWVLRSVRSNDGRKILGQLSVLHVQTGWEQLLWNVHHHHDRYKQPCSGLFLFIFSFLFIWLCYLLDSLECHKC